MKIIDQNHKIWGETPTDKEKSILWKERAGRVCYRSEDKIVEGSGQKFVENIIKRRHLSVIEHSNLVLRTKEKSKFPILTLQVAKSTFDSKYFTFLIHRDRIYISGNWRAWMEYYNLICPEYADMITLDNITNIFNNNEYETVENQEDIPNPLKAITVEFNTNRAMTHEIVRHRPVSYSQESQRYCRYGELVFIKPLFYDNASIDIKDEFIKSCIETERKYKWFLENGLSPQEARNVLTNAVCTKIIVTTNLIEWGHIFKLRCGGGADPQIIDLMSPVKEQFEINDWVCDSV